MSSYIAAAPIRKRRCVMRAPSIGMGSATILPIEVISGSQGKLFSGGKEVERYERGYRVLSAPGLATGIATQDATAPGQSIDVADTPGSRALAEAGEPFEQGSNLISDASGRVVVARVGVRLTEPILAIAMEESREAGQTVAVEIAPRGLMT
jgi:hypothetical protein